MYQTIYGMQVIKLRILNCHFKVLEIFFWHIGIKKVMKSDVWLLLLCAKVDIWSTFFLNETNFEYDGNQRRPYAVQNGAQKYRKNAVF